MHFIFVLVLLFVSSCIFSFFFLIAILNLLRSKLHFSMDKSVSFVIESVVILGYFYSKKYVRKL